MEESTRNGETDLMVTMMMPESIRLMAQTPAVQVISHESAPGPKMMRSQEDNCLACAHPHETEHHRASDS